jgi:hypothetical protein
VVKDVLPEDSLMVELAQDDQVLKTLMQDGLHEVHDEDLNTAVSISTIALK